MTGVIEVLPSAGVFGALVLALNVPEVFGTLVLIDILSSPTARVVVSFPPLIMYLNTSLKVIMPASLPLFGPSPSTTMRRWIRFSFRNVRSLPKESDDVHVTAPGNSAERRASADPIDRSSLV